MSQEQFKHVIGMIQALNNNLDAFKDEVGTRFDNLERRMTTMETVVCRSGTSNPTAVLNHSQGPSPFATTTAATRTMGSGDNARFLPFAIEHIAWKHQSRHRNDDRTCSFCNSKTFSLSCFRLDHFRWCRVHQRPILPPHSGCGRDYVGCGQVKWEVHPQWETIVKMSYTAGLGNKGVHNLEEKLFPREDFPARYNRNDQYLG